MKDADKEQYLKRGTLAVLGVMKDLLRSETPLMVAFSHGQFISRMLDADEERIIFDLGSNNLDNEYILDCCEIGIFAETQGAKVEFALTTLEKTTYDGLPAFSAPLDLVFYCHSERPDGRKVRFRLQDLSLGGIGVLVDKPLPEGLSSGDKFKKLRVELGEYGQFEVSAQLLQIGERSVVTSKNETRITPRLSFRVTAMEPLQSRQLQQVIFVLERLAHDKARSFQ
ncbi:flagellar brake protein [Candidatus Pantoea persica]|uniref:flagellar brake protein n=1 Tax=Candidatus Pantoea persica TaxID=2518128 RepID=UPI00215D8F0C|nr:flagellar brake protein [Candidatus Pantoea persica]MBA2814539.1 flagellar brake protein YcgR [Candidatus Pantoea persica]